MNEILEEQIKHKDDAAKRAAARSNDWRTVELQFWNEKRELEKQKNRFEQGTVVRNKILSKPNFDAVNKDVRELYKLLEFIEHNKALSQDDYDELARQVYWTKLSCLRLTKELK